MPSRAYHEGLWEAVPEGLAPAQDDVVKDFDNWLARELAGINSALSAKQLEPIAVLTREGWEKQTRD